MSIVRSSSGTRYGWAWVPIPLLLLTMLALWVADLRTSYESRTLLILTNLVFTWLVSMCVALVARAEFPGEWPAGPASVRRRRVALGLRHPGGWRARQLRREHHHHDPQRRRLRRGTLLSRRLDAPGAGAPARPMAGGGLRGRPGSGVAARLGRDGGMDAAFLHARPGWHALAAGGAGLGHWDVGRDGVADAEHPPEATVGVLLFLRAGSGAAGDWPGGSVVAVGPRQRAGLDGAPHAMPWRRLPAHRGTGRGADRQVLGSSPSPPWRQRGGRGELLPTFQKEPTLWLALRYAFGAATVAAAFGLHQALAAGVGAALPPFILFYPAVMVVALLAGWGRACWPRR